MPNLHDMTPAEREKLIQAVLTQALDAFQKGGVPAQEVMMAIDAYINVRLGEAIRMINEILEKNIVSGVSGLSGDPRKTMQ